MAKVYGGVEGINPPKYIDYANKDYSEYELACRDYIKSISDWCKQESPNCPDAGELLFFGIADGSANYVILNYRELIHLSILDSYSMGDVFHRGIRKADIVKQVKLNKENRKKPSMLFGNRIDIFDIFND